MAKKKVNAAAQKAHVAPRERRRRVRTVHRIDARTSYRDELLARVELVGFLTKHNS